MGQEQGLYTCVFCDANWSVVLHRPWAQRTLTLDCIENRGFELSFGRWEVVSSGLVGDLMKNFKGKFQCHNCVQGTTTITLSRERAREGGREMEGGWISGLLVSSDFSARSPTEVTSTEKLCVSQQEKSEKDQGEKQTHQAGATGRLTLFHGVLTPSSPAHVDLTLCH